MIQRLTLHFIFFVVALSTSLLAPLPTAAASDSGLRLFAWQAHADTPRFVIPVKRGESPKAAARRYLHLLSQSSDLMKLFPRGLPKFQFDSFEALSPAHFYSQALLIANHEWDYQPKAKRTSNFAKLYSSAEQNSRLETFVLPVAANLGLAANESQELNALVSRSFSLLTAMGGHDANPELYGQENRHARDVSPTRDQFEINLIRNYVATSDGFMFAICRGHQMTSIALGYELIQDLPTEKPSDVSHAEGSHPIQVVDTAFGVLKRATQGNVTPTVNTLHHQSVVYKAGGPAVPAAFSPDGVVEGLEFKNGRGLTLQFHPELMGNDLGRRIMREIVYMKNRTVRRACRDTFANVR